ncbi:hypothetical protein BC938DRAFT_483360 [Jimgerdemannia flammicorona]|uniref:F-box domain-containing protein n=1 Tax=Jimgerdemannia flammicorona TaxID=994334 RepID=A0A433QC95_9FUNG|nr:hypothetical protein BC938DRAFT_483360 [Jimgerdemannia flammicorona]
MPQALYLPPEVLDEILRLLLPNDKREFLFDLLAASLTCHRWRMVASRHFDDRRLKRLFEKPDWSLADLHRAESLLAESLRLGVNDGYLVELVRLRVSDPWFGVEPESEQAAAQVAAILSLTPNLTHVSMDLGAPDTHAAWLKLQAVVEPLCPNVTWLYVTQKLFGGPPERLTELVSRMASLKDIEFHHLNLPAELMTALARHPGIKYATFRRTGILDLHLCVSRWPNLRMLKIRNPIVSNCERLWEEVATSCPKLCWLIYKRGSPRGRHADEEADGTGLARVITRCRKLERLDVESHPGVGDVFLAAAMREGRRLMRVTFAGCRNVMTAPGGPWEAVERPWPRLEHLEMTGCGELTDGFVEKVLDRCSRLSKLVLPMHPEEGSMWPGMLEARSFVQERDGVWQREMGGR